MKAHRGWLRVAALCLLLVPAAFAAHAQTGDYPGKPVTIISDAGAGAAPDVVTRLVAEGLGRVWGQQVVVLNRPGGNGSIAAHAAAEAVPDGYTLYAPVLSTFVASPSVAPNLPVKLPRDFSAVGFIASQPMFVSVDPALGIATLPQLIARARQEPDKISFAVTGVGRLSHLTGELLQMRAGIKLQSIPYTRGPAAALSDVASGRVSLIIENYGGVAGAIGSGQVKPIAVAASERLPEFPDLATVAETIPGFAAAGWVVVVAPKGTPAPVVAKVSADLAKVVTDPAFKKKLAVIGSYSRAMTPAEVRTFVAQEQETWLPVLERISK